MRVSAFVGCCLAAALVAGCYHTSPPPRQDDLAMWPHGVRGTIELNDGSFVVGELLTIDVSGYTMLTENRVVVVPFARSRVASFPHIEASATGRPGAEHFDQMRYSSRFPYGIPGVALTSILKCLAQDTPDSVRIRER